MSCRLCHIGIDKQDSTTGEAERQQQMQTHRASILLILHETVAYVQTNVFPPPQNDKNAISNHRPNTLMRLDHTMIFILFPFGANIRPSRAPMVSAIILISTKK